MSDKQHNVIPDDLLRAFTDEETEVWIPAAIEIGRRGAQAEAFLRDKLTRTDELYAWRHAFCALAAYLDECRPGSDVRLKLGLTDERGTEPLKATVQRWLVDILLIGLKPRDPSLAELRSELPAAALWIEENTEQLRLRRTRLDQNEKTPAEYKQRELDVLDRGLKLWEADETRLSQIEQYKAETVKKGQQKVRDARGELALALRPDEWVFASFVAGATPALLDYLEIPLALFVSTVAWLARTHDRIGLVKSLPRLLRASCEQAGADAAVLDALIRELVKLLPSADSEPVHWVEYTDALQALIVRRGLDAELALPMRLKDCLEPTELRDAYAAWAEGQTERSAITLARTAAAQFCKETLWREKREQERLALAVFAMVLRKPGNGCSEWATFTLAHRIQVVREQIKEWEKHQKILRCLTRLLQILIRQEFEAAPPGSDVSGLCRRQIYVIQPLVAAWNLRGDIYKRLAAIAARPLCRVYELCASKGKGKEKELDAYRRLLYAVLYALPEKTLLKAISRYAAGTPVAAHLRAVHDFVKAGEHEALKTAFTEYVRQIWTGHGAEPDRHPAWQLVARLCRWDSNRGLSLLNEDGSSALKEQLRWMIDVFQDWRVEAEAGHPEGKSSSFKHELSSESAARTNRVVQQFESLLGRIAAHERAIRDVNDDPDSIVAALRRNLDDIRELQALCRERLPFVERELVGAELDRYHAELVRRLAHITGIVDGEDEKEAARTVHEERPAVPESDRRLIVNWMLGRHMLRELAPPENRILRRLLSPRWVACWIALPFLLTGLIRVVCAVVCHMRGCPDWPAIVWGWPFIVVVFANLLLLLRYHRRPGRLPGGLSRASLLLPQMVGTLFLGIMQSFSADETWTAGFLGHPLIRWANIGIFLGGAYFFVRYVMMKGQNPRVPADTPEEQKRARDKILGRRAKSVLALGLWQSFAIITLFALLKGPVMSSAHRANLIGQEGAVEELDPLSRDVQEWLVPNVIELGPKDTHSVRLVIFPWAMLTWTVQLFFFGAIFERIMSKDDG